MYEIVIRVDSDESELPGVGTTVVSARTMLSAQQRDDFTTMDVVEMAMAAVLTRFIKDLLSRFGHDYMPDVGGNGFMENLTHATSVYEEWLDQALLELVMSKPEPTGDQREEVDWRQLFKRIG